MKPPPLPLSGKLVASLVCLSLSFALLAGAMPWSAGAAFFLACVLGAAAVKE